MQILRVISAGRTNKNIGFRNESEVIQTIKDIWEEVDLRDRKLDALKDTVTLVTAAKKGIRPKADDTDRKVKTVIDDRRGNTPKVDNNIGDFTVKFSIRDVGKLKKHYGDLKNISFAEDRLNDIIAYNIQNPMPKDILESVDELQETLEDQRREILSFLKSIAKKKVPKEFKRFTLEMSAEVAEEYAGDFELDSPDVTVDLPFDYRDESTLPEGYSSIVRFKYYRYLYSKDRNSSDFILTLTNIVGPNIYEVRLDLNPGNKFKDPVKIKDAKSIGNKVNIDGELLTTKPRSPMKKLIDKAFDVLESEMKRSRTTNPVMINYTGIVLDPRNFHKKHFPSGISKVDIDDGTIGSQAAVEVVVGRGALDADGNIPFELLTSIVETIYAGVVADYKDVEIVTIHKGKQRIRFEFVEGGHGVHLDPRFRQFADQVMPDKSQQAELFKWLRQNGIGLK